MHLRTKRHAADVASKILLLLERNIYCKMLLLLFKRDCTAGDHRLRRGNLSIKKGPADRKEPQKEGWYMQRLPKSGQPWMDIYFFFEKVSALTLVSGSAWQTLCTGVPQLRAL